MGILQVISFPMRVEGATCPMFVYGEPAGRVIFVRDALISVEEAARISLESVQNDGGVIKEHNGSVSEGLASYQGHFPVDDRALECLPSAKVRGKDTPLLQHAQMVKTEQAGVPDSREAAQSSRVPAKE